jgi:hypothetical protein
MAVEKSATDMPLERHISIVPDSKDVDNTLEIDYTGAEKKTEPEEIGADQIHSRTEERRTEERRTEERDWRGVFKVCTKAESLVHLW